MEVTTRHVEKICKEFHTTSAQEAMAALRNLEQRVSNLELYMDPTDTATRRNQRRRPLPGIAFDPYQ